MKAFFFLLLTLGLIACGGDGSSDASNSQASGDVAPVITFDFALSTKRLDNSITLDWRGQKTASEDKQWVQFALCFKDENLENDCLKLKEGKRTDGFTSLKLGEDLSLAKLVTTPENTVFFLLFDEKGTVLSQPIPVAITQEFINQTAHYLKASNPSISVEFGTSVAISQDGKTLAIGAVNEKSLSNEPEQNPALISGSGAVYVFTHTEKEGWQQSGFLKPKVIETKDGFGSAVVMSAKGDVIAVSMTGEDASGTGVLDEQAQKDNSNEGSGAVVVFELLNQVKGKSSKKVWQQTAFLKASRVANTIFANNALAISDDGLLIAASLSAPAQIDIFQKQNNAWQASSRIEKPTDLAQDHTFGYRLALNHDGSFMVVSSTSLMTQSKLHTYSRASGMTDFEQGAEIIVAGLTQPIAARFGSALDLSADGLVLAVGSYDIYSVFILDYDSKSEKWKTRYQIPTYGEQNRFGSFLSLSDDGSKLAVFGALTPFEPIGLVKQRPAKLSIDRGSITVFSLQPERFEQLFYAMPKTPVTPYTNFGTAHQLSGNGKVLVTGASSEDANTSGVNQEAKTNGELNNVGAAWVIEL